MQTAHENANNVLALFGLGCVFSTDQSRWMDHLAPIFKRYEGLCAGGCADLQKRRAGW